MDLYGPVCRLCLQAGSFILGKGIGCTHEGTRVQYKGGPNDFYCPSHGAVFSSTGSVVSGAINRPLTRYTVAEANDILHITG